MQYRKTWLVIGALTLMGPDPASASGARATQVEVEQAPIPPPRLFLHIDGHHPDHEPQMGRRVPVTELLALRKDRNPSRPHPKPRFPVHPREWLVYPEGMTPPASRKIPQTVVDPQ